MTDTGTAPKITDADTIAILEARDYARIQFAKLRAMTLHPYHAGHAMIAESFVLMFGADIETARKMANALMDGFLEAMKADTTAPPPAAPSPSNNVVPINRSES
jgi:hypothetical protein